MQTGARTLAWRIAEASVIGVLVLPALGGLAIAAPDATKLALDSQRASQVLGGKFELTFELASSSGGKRVRKVTSLIATNVHTRESSRLTRFDYPADAKGLATLLVEHNGGEDELWVYLPAAKKARRLFASNKRDSFMGTVLSHGDVLGHKPLDWTHQNNGDGTVDEQFCWRVVSLPKNEDVRRNSGYSKREMWLDKVSTFPLRTDFWDESGKLSKTIVSKDVRRVAEQPGAYVSYRIEARDLISSSATTITIDRFTFKNDLDSNTFHPAELGVYD